MKEKLNKWFHNKRNVIITAICLFIALASASTALTVNNAKKAKKACIEPEGSKTVLGTEGNSSENTSVEETETTIIEENGTTAVYVIPISSETKIVEENGTTRVDTVKTTGAAIPSSNGTTIPQSGGSNKQTMPANGTPAANPTSTTQSTTKTPEPVTETTTKSAHPNLDKIEYNEANNPYLWSQDRVDAMVKRLENYAVSLGYNIDHSLTPETKYVGYSQPAYTCIETTEDAVYEMGTSDMRDCIMQVCNNQPEKVSINVVAKQTHTYGQGQYWEFYVLYY